MSLNDYFVFNGKRYVPDRPAGTFAFVLHDWQLERYDYKPRSLTDPTLPDDRGFPEMCPFNPRPGVKLTENLQWFWFNQLVLSAGDIMTTEELKEAWRGLTKSQTAFTNRRGTDVCWDYIRQKNEGASLPLLLENTCGGTTIELFNSSVYANGYKVKTLRISDYETWKNWTFLDHPQFFTKATNATVTPYGGRWRVEQFHYLQGRDVPVPIINSTGYVFIDPLRVRILADNEQFPRPYYP